MGRAPARPIPDPSAPSLSVSPAWSGVLLRGDTSVELNPDLKCLRLAATQHGVLTRDQARAMGLTDRQVDWRVDTGRWSRVHQGVFRLEGAPRTWRQRLKAVSLWAARDFALSHGTAAALWGFARYREAAAIHLSVTRNIRLPAPFVVHRVRALQPRDFGSVDGLRVTSRTRTLVDLCATEREPDVRASVDEALRRRWTTLARLEVALAGAGHRHGIRFLRGLVAAYRGGEPPTESELEARVHELLASAGLPRPTKQARLCLAGQVRRLDFHFPGTPVVIEADGYAFHSTGAMRERDSARSNQLTTHGLRVLHWTWAALRDRPGELLAQLRANLRAAAPPHFASR